MFKSVALPQGQSNSGKLINISHSKGGSNVHHRSSIGHRKTVLLRANIDVQATDAELKSLMEENDRLRRVMKDAAGKMGPEARQRFIKDYEKIADTAEKLGLEVDKDVVKAATAPSPSRVASKKVEPDHSNATRPPTFASFPSTPSPSSNNRGEAIDSKGYLMDIMNLSVDINPEELHQHSVASPAASKAEEGWESARKLIASYDPETLVAEKHHWMIVTVPEKPVAGEEFIVYFNRNASDSLRGKPTVQMKYGFNKWELKPSEVDSYTSKQEVPDWINLKPSGITRNMGSDFWSCRFRVPLDSFEVNFVLHDEKGSFENNNNQDFTYPVVGGITWDNWLDQAAERKAKAAEKAAATERVAAEEAERARQAAMIQDDREKGKRKASDLSSSYESLRSPVGGDSRWTTVPSIVQAGSKAVLKYNRLSGPLSKCQVNADQNLTLRYGFNNWQRPVAVELKRSLPTSTADPTAKVNVTSGTTVVEEWWEAEISVPVEAIAVNFVVNHFDKYDNNDAKDYKLLVSLPTGVPSVDAWSQSLSELFFKQMSDARLAAEDEAKKKEDARRIKRREAQAFVREVERRKVRHVLYTEPEVVKAGEEVTVFYNPKNTNLNGKDKIFLRGGWNRWSHARKFGPLPMTPPSAGGTHWKAIVKAPLDAFKMDFVFSDVDEGDGTYDARGGYDYHLPVEGSPVKEPSLYVAHIAVEMAPIAKVGGLGDVVTALGRAVKEQGHFVEVILPKFQFFNSSPILSGQLKYETEFEWGGTRIYVTTAIVEGLRCFFIEPRNGFFDTPTVYGRYDDEVRFDFFCKAALEFLLRSNRQPDILHCHDWSTAFVSKTYWDDYHSYGLWKPKVVFTIHNLNYGKAKLSQAAYYSQRFTTVSPTYAYEVGGSPVISSQAHKFAGIRNGIDMELWDPENNQWLPTPYNSDSVVEGKKAARKALRERVGLGGWGDKFIVGVVSRLTGQKGVHLIKHAAFRAVERGGQFVLLGSAPDPKVQAEFNALAQSYNGDVARFCFKYDEPLSHLIYAACDMIVVPSMFEPCGLTQMIAMRYGSVPIVRHTGGLRDTVFDVDFDKARAAWDVYGSSDWQRDGLDATNGFAFDGTDPGALDYALNRAIDAWYNDRDWFHGLQKRVMEQDWSWNRPALDYIELYHGAMKA